MIAEPDVALTDYGLAVEAGILAILVSRGARPGPLAWWWVAFFDAVAAAALLGGTVHGFLSAPTPVAVGAWRATLLAIGASGLAAWAIGAHVAFPARVARLVALAAGAVFAAYAAVVLLGADAFAVAIAHYVPPALFLLGCLVAAWRRTGARPLLLAVLGLVVLLAGSWVQWQQVALHPVYFTASAVYHVIEAVALLLLFRGARWLTTAPPGGTCA